MRAVAMLLAGVLTIGPAATAGAQTPQPPPGKVAAPTPPVYDEKADAKEQIAGAVARAARDNKRVLLQWGANWCGWCIALDGLFKSDKEIARLIQYEYELVHVDIGKWDKHMDLAAAYGADLKANGVPFLTVLDGGGKAIANQETSSLEAKSEKEGEEKLGHDPRAVRALLAKHKATARAAEEVLKGGLSKARNESKLVFLHFGAPWCGWCHRLEAWMARPEIAAVLAKDFVDVKIDIDRDLGGTAVQDRFNTRKGGGIPWFAFLDAEGKVVADSNGPKGNVGFPAAPEEIAHFAAMLRGAHKTITEAEIAALTASLEVAEKERQEQASRGAPKR